MPYSPLRLAVFDCDGTLVDSQFAIVGAMTAAFAAHDLPPPDPRAVRRVVGLSLPQAVALLLPDHDDGFHAAVAECYRDAFFRQRRSGTLYEPLFPGIRECLDALEAEGILLGVATGKSRRGLDAVLDHHGLAGRFVTLQTSDRGPGKPHPDMLYRALSEVGVSAAGTVMIGDTTFDIQMARNAHVASVGVSWGYHEVVELEAAGAARIVDSGEELTAAVLDMLRSPVA